MSLRVHTLSWRSIATIGIAIVVAGQFAGWNYGLSYGWVNMVAAAVLMLIFYLGLLQGLAEMAATWPSAGGLANYSRLAFGEWVGGMLSVSMVLGLIACAGVVASFIAAYAQTALGADAFMVKLLLFAGVMSLHLRGTKEAIWVVILAGAVAIATLLCFAAGTAPLVRAANLSIADQPLSFHGIVQAIPFALWLYLGVEQAVTASEEAENPGTDIPRALMIALGVLTLTAAGVILCAPGAGGIATVAKAGDPLLAALPAGAGSYFPTAIGVGALFGLLASFFSITYSASRQIYDLSRTGFFPSFFERTSVNGTPVSAFVVVTLSGFAVSLVAPERVLLVAVLLFTAAYFLTALAFLRLRKSMKDTKRAYRAFGGVGSGGLTLAISLLIFYACFNIDWPSILLILAMFAVAALCRIARRMETDHAPS